MEKTIVRRSATRYLRPLDPEQPILCVCFGVLVYIYGHWWKCRVCNRWVSYTPDV